MRTYSGKHDHKTVKLNDTYSNGCLRSYILVGSTNLISSGTINGEVWTARTALWQTAWEHLAPPPERPTDDDSSEYLDDIRTQEHE